MQAEQKLNEDPWEMINIKMFIFFVKAHQNKYNKKINKSNISRFLVSVSGDFFEDTCV